MVDISKLFESLRNKSDQDAKADLALALKDTADHPALRNAGYRVAQSNNPQVFSYSGGGGMSSNDSDLKEASLFYVAMVKNKLYCAALLLQQLGVEALVKATDLNENGFHAVARCDNQDFKTWFFTESVVATHTQLTNQYKELINKITVTDQHVLMLIPQNRLTIDEIQHWVRLGADPQCLGTKSGSFLHFLCEKNKLDLAKMIANQFRKLLHVRNDKGQMPIHIAAGLESAECLKMLIEADSPVAVEDKKFHRPLHTAIAKGGLASIQIILQQQPFLLILGKTCPYVNIPTATQDTALHILIAHNKAYTEARFKDAVDLLMGYGADTTLQNSKGQTPIRLARELVDEGKLTISLFEYLWEKLIDKLSMHLFSQETLFQKICAYYAPDDAQQLIAQLIPVFQAAGPSLDALHFIHQRYVEALKQQAGMQYPNNIQITQSFSIILDEVAKSYQATLTERTHTNAVLSFTQQAANPSADLMRTESSMQLNTW